MADPTYVAEVLLGKIRLGRFTGRIVTDDDGFSHHEQEDTVTFDQFGREVGRTPSPPLVRWKEGFGPRPDRFWSRLAWWVGR